MLSADLGDRGQFLRRVHLHSAGTLHQWFEDHGGDFTHMLSECLIQLVRIDPNLQAAKEQRLEATEEERVATDAHRAERVAVVAAFEADEERALRFAAMAPELVRHLERDLDRRAAVVRIEGPATVWPRYRAEQVARQLDGIGMRRSREEDVIEATSGVANGLHDRGLTVAVEDGPPRGDAVDDAAAIGEVQELVFRGDHR